MTDAPVVRPIEPPVLASEIFDLTMKGLETRLTVGDNASYALLSCDADDDAGDVLALTDLLPFDCIPVRDGDRIIGVLCARTS
jgi:hypothetical protein